MTETTTDFPIFGQTVGEAQTALRAVIVDVLEGAGTTFDRWVALNTLVIRGPAVAREELLAELAYGLQTSGAAISEVLDALSSAGLVRVNAGPGTEVGSMVELTDEGRTLHAALRATVRHASAALLDGLDPAEVQTTIAILQAVTERAEVFRGHASA